MTQTSLSNQINRLGLVSVIVVIASGIAALFLPLDVADGYASAHVDRVSWLSANSGLFITAWVNQIVAMFSLSSVLFCGAWQIADTNPLRAIIAGLFVLMSVVAFIIPKFIAIWTIPLLAESISSGAAGQEMANQLLPLLNVTIPFSLYTSFDYLGFWLYAVFGVLAAGPLYGNMLTSKIAAVSLGLFGVSYHVALVAVFFGAIAAADIESYFLGTTLLLLAHVVAMAFVFRKSVASAPLVPGI